MLFTKYVNEARTRLSKVGWYLYIGLTITGMGVCVGLLSLVLSAFSYPKLNGYEMLRSYLSNHVIVIVNLLLPILLIWIPYLFSGKGWVAFLWCFLPVMGITIANYYKIQLRSDPFLAVDLTLLSEASNIARGYTLALTKPILLTIVCFIAGCLFCVCLVPRCMVWNKFRRKCVAGGFLILMACYILLLCRNETLYSKGTENNELINQWSDVEVYVSKGCIYPFCHSVQGLFPNPPQGYSRSSAAEFLGQYEDADIPVNQKVSVMGIMLEAFCDLTDFPSLAEEDGIVQAYAPWHALEAESVSGDLLTNIFAGGTVDTEWGFLTGYTQHRDFRSSTDSYVWYLRNQGYQTFGSHPGYGWFYNRQNVNGYLGFEEYWFTENHYGALVDPEEAIYHSDHILVGELVKQLQARVADGPCFSFSVTYQNHGPYESAIEAPVDYFSETSPFTSETRNILNHYLAGIVETCQAMSELTGDLEEMQDPVVLVLFGDHKPWAGNDNSAYLDIGANFDISTVQGFYQYYSTPYVIWANSAAKEVLGQDFTGDGGDFSPCFLMTKVFDLCGWEGPAFMQMSRDLREVTPLVHSQGIYLSRGALADTLPEPDGDFLQDFLCAQYYRERQRVNKP